jgi:hypothetical protein
MQDRSEEKAKQPHPGQPSGEGCHIVEAAALEWQELLPGTQKAFERVVELLGEATNAQQKARPKEGQERFKHEELPTSILVSGDRGFGKTTVLLTAEYATRKGKGYLDKSDGKLEDLGNRLEGLQSRLFWLEMLDLEPTPGKANLLATVLVRIRDALDNRYPALRPYGHGIPASILEEGVEKPWKKIDHLIREATFMWEEASQTADPRRERAEQQIRAAETFARFQLDFRGAVGAVAKALGRDTEDGARVLVLPIDHVDRSVEHLYGIVKLMRMAFSPYLWFLLAAGREDFQLFLERAFQNELLAGCGAGTDAAFIDQTRAIARYQSATRLQRSLPDAYRIQIESATAKVAFAYPGRVSETEDLDLSEDIVKAAEGKSISNLEPATFLGAVLNKVPLDAPPPNDGLTRVSDLLLISRRLNDDVFGRYCDAHLKESDPLRRLDCKRREVLQKLVEHSKSTHCDLRSKLHELGLRSKLSDCELRAKLQEPPSPSELTPKDLDSEQKELDAKWKMLDLQWIRDLDLRFSFAAKTALNLSARTLRDLWLFVEERRSNKAYGGLDAEELAVRMLKIAIDDSVLPFWASELLHNSIIRKNAHRKWILDVGGRVIRPSQLTSSPEILKWGSPRRLEKVASSELQLRHLSDYNLELYEPREPGRHVPLPAHVAGWLMLLHDLLRLSDRVLSAEFEAPMPHEMMPNLVVTRHEFWFEQELISLDFVWDTPPWGLFLDHFVFIAQWKAFLEEIRERLREPLDRTGERAESGRSPRLPSKWFESSSFFPRLILAAWVENVCSVAGVDRGKWDWGNLGGSGESARNDGKRLRSVFGNIANDEASPKDYEKHVRGEIARLYELVKAKGNVILKDRRGKALVWLERSLPLFGLPEYAPGGDCSLLSGEEQGTWMSLRNRWKEHPSMVMTARQDLVRCAAEHSSFYRGLGESSRTPNLLAEARHWVKRLEKTWFMKVDPNVRHEYKNGLENVTRECLDGHGAASAVEFSSSITQ